MVIIDSMDSLSGAPPYSPLLVKNRHRFDLSNQTIFVCGLQAMLYPWRLSGERNFANSVTRVLSKDRKSVEETPLKIWRAKGFTELYRGFPLYLLHEYSVLFTKDVCYRIMKHVKCLVADPDYDLMDPTSFHGHVARYLGITRQKEDSARIPELESMTLKYINDHHPENQEDDEQEDDYFTTELVDFLVTCVAETVCYPLLTISQRQMVVDDEAGYSMASMFNVSRVMDGGVGWMYRGLEYHLLRQSLRTAGRITIDVYLDYVENVLDNPAIREGGKQLYSYFLSPLEILANLEKSRSTLPGLIDDEICSTQLINASITKNYRLFLAMAALVVPSLVVASQMDKIPRLDKYPL